jgi:hypothetical protein
MQSTMKGLLFLPGLINCLDLEVHIAQETGGVFPTDAMIGYYSINRATVPQNDPCYMADYEGNVGKKMDDACCEKEADWLAKFPLNKFTSIDTEAEPFNYTCYPMSNSLGNFSGSYGRLYVGCENGVVNAAEDCVPSDLEYVTQEQYDSFEAGKPVPWSYPLNATTMKEREASGTLDGCGCSQTKRFTEGPGCYIASANLAIIAFGADNAPGVLIKIGGTCAESKSRGFDLLIWPALILLTVLFQTSP